MLTLKPLEDKAALERIYTDPWITKVGHDHRPAAPIYHTAARYLGAYVGTTLVGAFLVIESGFIEMDMHALLSQKALPWCRDFGRMCLDFIFGHEHIQRVNAMILEGLESACNYAQKIGFKTEGFKRDSAQVGGKLVGIHMLGMTRADWSAA
jgi:hypothetical protein